MIAPDFQRICDGAARSELRAFLSLFFDVQGPFAPEFQRAPLARWAAAWQVTVAFPPARQPSG